MRLLYLCDANSGGIAEYAIRQCRALHEAGVEIIFLCRPDFETHRLGGFSISATLGMTPAGGGSRWQRSLRRIKDLRQTASTAVKMAETRECDALLIACYAEYFSPFWAGIYRREARRGLRIATIAHDPVRDFVLGPKWWHRWSVRQGYSFVRDVFVHDDTPVDFGGPKPRGICVNPIPHGPYSVPRLSVGREQMRETFGFRPGDQVFLSFGQIRDGKNLDRFLRAMVELPHKVKLLVAGSSAGGSVRQPEHYKNLARELGVANRCVWEIRYIPDEEIGDLFDASDFVLMTYSAKFRSASGVMNTAVACRKPVIASSGEGPLKAAVDKYDLGVFVTPDKDNAVLEGVRNLISATIKPNWELYERENSWTENAKIVIEAVSKSILISTLQNEERFRPGGSQK